MAQGPILIFDKSMLQSLNPDEANWLDNFFLTNITPIFFAETLADLELEIRRGRTPEQVVGNLAYKTPDMQSNPNVHHLRLLQGELSGKGSIVMDGRMMVPGGKPVELEGKVGVLFRKSEEEEALYRWQRGEFLGLERQIAKAWRQSLGNVNYDETYKFFQRWYVGGKPKTLSAVKSLAVANVDISDQQSSLEFGMMLLGVPESAQKMVMERWQAAGKPRIREFAPYFAYIYEVDLFFYLAIAADLISRIRPVNKVDNKVDLAYVYYLPFCMVFSSSDNLHERIVPLFLREDQTFVKGAELKEDLGRLDGHYSSLPDDVKRRGLHAFADLPPADPSFLVTRLWDKHLPTWRKDIGRPGVTSSKEEQKTLVDLLNRLGKDSRPLDPTLRMAPEDMDFVQIERSILVRKGKWRRFSPEVETKGAERRQG